MASGPPARPSPAAARAGSLAAHLPWKSRPTELQGCPNHAPPSSLASGFGSSWCPLQLELASRAGWPGRSPRPVMLPAKSPAPVPDHCQGKLMLLIWLSAIQRIFSYFY